MQILPTAIPDVKLVSVKRYADARGFFSETYSREALAKGSIVADFVQDNHSMSVKKGTIRGLHFQKPPHAQGKLVRVVRGSVVDVAVDIRKGSPTFGKHVAEVLSADNGKQMWVPPGFAHGFCTLEAGTEVVYKVTDVYAPELDAGLLWNDPALGIDWRLGGDEPVLSPKDQRHPVLAELELCFAYAR